MRNIFENKPKFFFLVEVILVVVAIIAAFAAGYIYKDTVGSDKDDGAKDTSVKLYTYTDAELQALTSQKTVTGRVVRASAISLTITVSGKNVVFALTEDTVIEKGATLTTSSYKELSAGKQVTVSYNSKTDKAINVWFEK